MTEDDGSKVPAWAEVARRGAWFASAPEALRVALVDAAELRLLAAGQRLFGRGEAPDGLYCLVSGAIRITGVSEDGDEALLAVLEPPQWFGEIALFDSEPRTHDAWAETDARLARIPLDLLERLLADHPEHWRHLGRLVTQKLRLALVSLEETALLTPTARVARRLAMIATAYGARAGQRQRAVAVSQAQLALLLALSRQTVNRSLGTLESRGAIRRARGAIEIVDFDKLLDPGL